MPIQQIHLSNWHFIYEWPEKIYIIPLSSHSTSICSFGKGFMLVSYAQLCVTRMPIICSDLKLNMMMHYYKEVIFSFHMSKGTNPHQWNKWGCHLNCKFITFGKSGTINVRTDSVTDTACWLHNRVHHLCTQGSLPL